MQKNKTEKKKPLISKESFSDLKKKTINLYNKASPIIEVGTTGYKAYQLGDAINQHKDDGILGMGIQAGVSAGALIGSVFPVIGTTIGGGIGGVIGGVLAGLALLRKI